ncbi:sodium-dependent transporter [Haladaptatus sp. DJG-WS-42]|uniref:sodium-dependent transporter n=1 Tax=Haladaptatus sp. DJG-WS-42 TaxID=3120516 RepID=UPI0030CDA0A6
MSDRETWATRMGFILAAVGSAVGLGNLWQFPFKTATNGGAAFLVVYIGAAIAIGFPAMLAEFVIGRRTNLNTISAFKKLGFKNWRIVGALGLFTGFWILSYYSVVGGWVLRYIGGSATGAYFGAPGEYFGAISAGPEALALHAVFMAITIGIVAFGIEGGIEKATKLMVPSIALILVGLAGFAYVNNPSAAMDAYGYFLNPDLSVVRANFTEIVPFAVGQAFFSLSLGMGAMITYASYLGNDDNLAKDGLMIVFLNSLVGILAGLVVFPLLFAQGIDPNTSGPGALFVAVASAFADLGGLGRIVGVIFFGVVLIAALSSAISLLEVVVAYIVDHYDVGRKPAALSVGGIIFALGIPSALDIAWLGWFDTLAYKFLLPFGVLLLLFFVGWVLGGDASRELLKGMQNRTTFSTTWLWTVRTVVLLGVIVTLGFGIQTLMEEGIMPPL